MRYFVILIGWFLVVLQANANLNIRQAWYLNPTQIKLYQKRLAKPENKPVLEKLLVEFAGVKDKKPNPLSQIHFEGLLENDPRRIASEKALQDMDHLGILLYAFYLKQDKPTARKMKEYILAWSQAYKPTGNPINENKLEPIWISFAVTQNYFNQQEKEQVKSWLKALAQKMEANTKIPRNNWISKKIKIVGTIGLLLTDQKLTRSAIKVARQFVNESLFSDGTSLDLKERDALSYHNSGLVPILVFDVHLKQFGWRGNEKLYTYQSPEGASLKKSVDYVKPYATGQQKRQEWVNTKVALDKKRAAAGLSDYQPGKFFNPGKANALFEVAAYYEAENKNIARQLAGNKSTLSLLIMDILSQESKI